MPELSVIIPVYNTELYLRECLNSVVAQTYKDMEIICVNDGSTDNSLEILNEYKEKDTRIKVITIKNQGPATARNTGLYAATGKYITFVDSDDYIEKTTYEKALQHITDANIVCFGIDVFGDYSLKTRKSDSNYYKISFKGKTKLNNKIRYKTDCSVCNKIFKKSLINDKEINFPQGRRYEDAAFYWKYIASVKTAWFIDENLYKYRRRERSIMAETFEQGKFAVDHLYIIDDLYNYLIKHNLYNQNLKLFAQLFKEYFFSAYRYTLPYKQVEILQLGSSYARKFFSTTSIKCSLIKSLINNDYDGIWEPDLNLFQKIFSIKNVKTSNKLKKIKLFCILGMKFRREQILLSNRSEYKISVIIPVYNVEQYLRQCLDSVVNQTLKDIEIILVDDGSTDSSLSICNEYAQKDCRIKVLKQNHKGAGAARNKGLEIARGEYLSILDSDDFFELDMLEKLYDEATENNADITICDMKFYDTQTHTTQKSFSINKDCIPDKTIFSYKDMPDYIFNTFQNWSWNKLFKTEFVKTNNIKFQEIKRTNDLYFTCCALVLANKITYLDEKLAYYRFNTTSNCQSTNYIAPKDFVRAFIKLKKFLEKKNIYKAVKRSYINWAIGSCLYNLRTLEKYPDAHKKLLNYLIDTGFQNMDITQDNKELFNLESEYNEFIKLYNLKDVHYKNKCQRIFSIKNALDRRHKIITFLGLRIKLRRK